MKRAASAAGLPAEAEVRLVEVKRARPDLKAIAEWNERDKSSWRNAWRELEDGSIEMELTKGTTAILDKDDHDKVKYMSWWFGSQTGYAYSSLPRERGKSSKNVSLHQHIMSPPPGLEVDHINRNRLDNRKKNMRNVSRSTNHRNKPVDPKNTTGENGISEVGWFAFVHYYDGKRKQEYACFRPNIDGAREKAKQRIKAKRTGRFTKSGTIPPISTHFHFAVNICPRSSDGRKSKFTYREDVSNDRRRALGEAVSFRNSAQTHCASSNGMAPANT